MERGYVKVYRKMLDCRSYSRSSLHRALMLTILLKANWKTGYFRGELIEPGQFGGSVKGLAEELSEPRTNVIRALADLVEDGFVTVEKVDTKWTRFCIINWDIYQQNENSSGHQTNSKRTANGHNQRIKEFKNKEDSESKDSSSSTASDAAELVLKGKHKTIKGRRAEAFNRFWEAFSYKKDKAQAIDAWAALPPLTDAFVDRICDAAKQEAARRPDYEAKGRSPQYAQGWINGRRWEDEPNEPQVQLINVWRKRDA